jgi:hypothetical protein
MSEKLHIACSSPVNRSTSYSIDYNDPANRPPRETKILETTKNRK